MRGYGGSSVPEPPEAYAIQQIVGDMVELHEHLGSRPAVWVGHDLGSPVAGALAAHHTKRVRGVVLCSVPYFSDAFALASVLPFVDRSLYPVDQYPDGQWSYYRFHQTHFDQTVAEFDADIPASLAAIYRQGDPNSVGKVYRSALVAQQGGWFANHRAPSVAPDTALWPTADFATLVDAFRRTGFRPANTWYLNDSANIAYAHAAPDGGRLHQPVLFINGDLDGLCDITRSRFGEPMRGACENLSVTGLKSGHWLPLERKSELVESIKSWLATKPL
jgi:pimeloyl-ACP methyl ester carboxylesterase